MDEKQDLRDYFKKNIRIPEGRDYTFDDWMLDLKDDSSAVSRIYNKLENPELSLEDWTEARVGDVKKKDT